MYRACRSAYPPQFSNFDKAKFRFAGMGDDQKSEMSVFRSTSIILQEAQKRHILKTEDEEIFNLTLF